MGFDGDLVLGLGLSASLNTTPTKSENNKRFKSAKHPLLKMELASPATEAPNTSSILEPSLTLGLPSDTSQEEDAARNDATKVFEEEPPGAERFARQASPHSAVSSFSNVGKRDRDVVSEEVEAERGCSRASDEDEENINSRKKLRLNKEQSTLLEESFKQHSTLNPKQKQALARQLNLRPRQVEVWFQNRRARTKLKQTELDLEVLKKCCETLTAENRRLQKELQELKALKLAHPFYMNMSAATLTMCPSCERTGAAVASENSPRKIPFSMASKPHFFNPFTNPSAAC